MLSTPTFFQQKIITKNQKVQLLTLKEKEVTLFIKREDEIHPDVSGNKFRKLKYNIKEAKQQQQKKVLTFGGAFSNHILATAVAAKLNGFKSIGIIRGEELADDVQQTLQNNSTLQKAHKNGMQFYFVSREQYREKESPDFMNNLKEKFGNFYTIPEGGTNDLAIQGCEEILCKEDECFDVVCCAVGTGGTISGLINASKEHQKVIGFPALKGDFLKTEVQKYTAKKNWLLNTNYHFGGYAKYTPEFITFLNNFSADTKILLDPIYTGKLIFGILDLVKQDYFAKGTKILAIHTGGIQGIEGFNKRLKQKNKQLINLL